jgi:hypothetical protein
VAVPLGGNPATGAVGSVTQNITIALTGVGTQGAVGTVSMTGRGATLTGNVASGSLGTMGVFYWSLIDDSETANWQNVNTAQTPGWSVLNTQ